MAIQDVWIENLKALVQQEGGGRPGLRKVSDISGVNVEYLHQLVTGKPDKHGNPRQMGSSVAKKLSIAYADDRPIDWFDYRQTSAAMASAQSTLSASATAPVERAAGATDSIAMSAECQVLCRMFQTLPDDAATRGTVLGQIMDIISRAHDPTTQATLAPRRSAQG